MFGLREAVEDGLMSYGETLSRSHFRAAYFVPHRRRNGTGGFAGRAADHGASACAG
jgi:hypothetical protein